MTTSEIKIAFARLGGRANKKLGQHFLIDRAALEAIVEAAEIVSGETVLEIGPGLGVLTDALTDRGANVIAIEQDRRFHNFLIRANRKVVHGDAAKVDWDELVENKPWKFVANLPYAMTSLALRKALYAVRPPDRVVVLVQREVAERAIAKNKKTSLLSLMVALASKEAKIVRRVPAGAFYPPPKVESAILKIVPMTVTERIAHWGIEPERIMELARRGFAHPRKFLSSNLGLDATGRSILSKTGIADRARAEDLSPQDWAALT